MTQHSDEGTLFSSRKFGDWATVKEALIAKDIGGVFILAPMAMQLRADGIPIKVVYLGHRDGGAIVVGDTWSTNFRTTPGAYQQMHAGEGDSWVAGYLPMP